jgi:hypothetical protein
MAGAAVATAPTTGAAGAAAGVAAPAPACTGTATTEQTALTAAKACARAVVVDSSRTEFTQVTAQPDGRLTFESAVEPQRVHTAQGWVDVDLSLTRRPDGRWGPAASVADVSFSGGGKGPLVTLSRAGRQLTLSWPGADLPAPTVSGDSATFGNVLADVDLVVRATRSGFTHALVVKSAAAAANPAIREVRFGLGGDVEVRRRPDGTLQAVAGDTLVAGAAPAVMWDSRTVPRTVARTGVRSTADAAGDGARTASVRTEVVPGGLVLRPDRKLLDGPGRSFPIFIDPDWSVFKSKWAYATNNGSSNEVSRARVGRSPESGAIYRSFFAFPTTANGVTLKGKHVRSARVEMKLDHSWDCANTDTSMYLVPPINAVPRASWPAMALSGQLAWAEGHANEAGGCSPIRPDMVMNFAGSALTGTLQTAANDRWEDITVGFTAHDRNGNGESVQQRWKKFFPNDSKLFADYDSIPGTPTDLQVAGVACPPAGTLTVGTLTPTLSAVLRDEDSQSLTGAFEWVDVPASGNPNEATVRRRVSPDPTATANTRATTTSITIVLDKTYAFRVSGTDPAPYNKSSGWSPWCLFAADNTVPPAPTIDAGAAPGPGRPLTFTFRTTSGDVVKFRYGWASPPGTEVAATGTGTKTASVTVTAPSFGKNTLWVRGIDATGNLGNLGSKTVTVGRPSPPVASWALETHPGLSQAQALSDRQPALAGDTALTPTGLGWASDVRTVGGQSATFDRTAHLSTGGAVINTTNSYSVAAWVRLADADPADPDPDLPTGNWTAAGQSGSRKSAFYLGLRRTANGESRWGFMMTANDTDDPGGTTTVTAAPVAATEVGRWVHLAGVYDAAAREQRIYVDGALAGSGVRPISPWNATGPVTVGAALWTPPAEQPRLSDGWAGQIADVQVFDRVLVPHDFTGQLASDPLSGRFNEPGILAATQVGGWNFDAAVPCYVADLRDTCEAPDGVTAYGRWLALTRGSAVGAGRSTSDSGLWLDYEYFPDEGFTEASEEYGRSAVKAGLTPPDANGHEYTRWQDRPAVRTDQSFTLSAWVMLADRDGMRTALSQRGGQESAAILKYVSTSGKWQFRVADEDVEETPTAVVSSVSDAQAGVWTHLAGVYDAGRRQLRLYVNGQLQGSQGLGFTPMASSGPLLVGRALWRGGLVDQWVGGIDDVAVFQGALNETSVFTLYQSQVPPPAGVNTLTRGQRLNAGQKLRSDTGGYELLMQVDGNLVLYQAGVALWDTRTWGNPGAYAHMQTDGNLVVYRPEPGGGATALWDTRTWGTTADRLVIRDDGDLTLSSSGGQVFWHR